MSTLPSDSESFDTTALIGLPVDDVQARAAASGFTNVDVFASTEDVVSTLEFNPQRLLVVVEDGIVVDAIGG